jgi:A/G-specific adenine glycosylase
MQPLSKKQITEFQKYILDWYSKNKRDFPWRHTRDPYKILVSEIMSQQAKMRTGDC